MKGKIILKEQKSIAEIMDIIFQGLDRGKAYQIVKKSENFSSSIDIGITKKEYERRKKVEENSINLKNLLDTIKLIKEI
ncbi:MAG: hypothetical protein ACRCVT_10065 [Leadbetterella sp.]